MGHNEQHYINGQWVDGTSGQLIEVINPATEDVAGSISAGTPTEVDQAVRAARAAFDGWAATSPGSGPLIHSAANPRRKEGYTVASLSLVASKISSPACGAATKVCHSVDPASPS